MNSIKQIAAITLLSLRSVPQRIGSSLVIITGIAGVVAVLLSVLAMSAGLTATMERAGRADRAIVLRKGADSESASTLSRDAAAVIAAAPGIRKMPNRQPMVSPEVLAVASLRKKGDGSRAEVTVRGISPMAFAVRPELTLTAGRQPRTGLREVIVGRSAQAEFEGLELGGRVPIRDGEWSIVGQFDTHGDARESELLVDADTLQSAYQSTLFQSVTVQLESADAFDALNRAVTTNPTLASLDVQREQDYYRQQSQRLARVLSVVAYLIGGIMALGAMFGAINTMYSAVSVRTKEIATLRAMGFGPAGMVVSVLIEAEIFSLIGASLGAAIAWVAFNGNTISTIQGSGQLITHLSIGGSLFWVAVIWGSAIGLVGGLFPAVRAARLPVATALRAV